MAPDDSVCHTDSLTSSLVKKTQSWVQIDAKGQCFMLDVDKFYILHRFHINARDLRILDPLLGYPSTILGRDKAILLNLEYIQAIITAEEVLLRDPTNENVIPVVEELKRRLSKQSTTQQQQDDEKDESPFEFGVLEIVLESICSSLDACTTELETNTYPVLDQLASKISGRNLDKVRKLKSAMTSMIVRVRTVKEELEQLLDDEDDMADLYLSRKTNSTTSISGSGAENLFSTSPTNTTLSDENDVEEIEMLLEDYFRQIDDTLNKLTHLREYIDDTEDYLNIQLDNHRNKLIQFELILSCGTLSLTFWSLIAGIFGMNFPFGWNEHHNYMFKWVVTFSAIISAIIFFMITGYAKKKGLLGSL